MYEANLARTFLLNTSFCQNLFFGEGEGSHLKGSEFQSALDGFLVYFSEILPIQEGVFIPFVAGQSILTG